MLWSELASPTLSLTAAASWGAADFSGGFATKRSGVLGVVAVAHTAGLAVMIGLALASREPVPARVTVMWGVLAGISGAIGLASLYKGLAVGKMGITAPVAAVVTAILPVLVGFHTEGRPRAYQFIGFGLAAISIWLIAMPAEGRVRAQGMGLAVLAGMGFGGFLVLSRQAGTQAVFWPLAASRSASVLFMLTLAAVSGRDWKPAKSSLRYVILAGILDSVGNALFVSATRVGRLDVAAVLSSFYPVTTVILARVLLKEQLSRWQSTGMALALAAVPLIVAR